MIVGHNDFTMTGITLEQCKDACLNDSSCQSIEYRNSSTLCYLQYIRRDGLSTQADFITEQSTDYYEWTNCSKFIEDNAHWIFSPLRCFLGRVDVTTLNLKALKRTLYVYVVLVACLVSISPSTSSFLLTLTLGRNPST